MSEKMTAFLLKIVKDVMKLEKFTIVLVAVCVLFGLLGRASGQIWSSTNIVENWTSLAMSADGSKIAAASFLGGIYTTTNAGTSWTNIPSLEPEKPVLATSTNGGNLVVAFFDGRIFTSPDWGMTWIQSAAPVDYWNCLASSWDGTKLVAGTAPGVIYTSKDSGATFTQAGCLKMVIRRSRPPLMAFSWWPWFSEARFLNRSIPETHGR